MKEEEMFAEYLENIYIKYGDKSLSYFEHNLEVSNTHLYKCLLFTE